MGWQVEHICKSFTHKFFQKLTKSKRKSLHELKHHSATLVETNGRLAQDIQQTDASTAKHARDLLQQYEMFGVRLRCGQ